ncbi:hypothetical protein ACJZ2D_016997 [Fusarium nematophilum]
MASNTAEQDYEWLIILPHHEEVQAAKTGIPVSRDLLIAHREKVFEEPDLWLCGGLVLKEPATDLNSAKFKRSHMILKAPSKEAIIKRLRKDSLYPTLWDLDKIQIEPFCSVIRKGIENPPVDGNLPA